MDTRTGSRVKRWKGHVYKLRDTKHSLGEAPSRSSAEPSAMSCPLTPCLRFHPLRVASRCSQASCPICYGSPRKLPETAGGVTVQGCRSVSVHKCPHVESAHFAPQVHTIDASKVGRTHTSGVLRVGLPPALLHAWEVLSHQHILQKEMELAFEVFPVAAVPGMPSFWGLLTWMGRMGLLTRLSAIGFLVMATLENFVDFALDESRKGKR